MTTLTRFLVLSVMLLGVRAQAQAAGDEAAMTTTPSGLRYVITARGSGPAPQPGQVVIAHYVGSLADGTRFDSSRDRGQPFAFTLGRGRVIKGWDEGFALLHVGDKATFLIPPALAYGARKAGPIPPNSTLRFEVELIDVKEKALSEVLLGVLEASGADAAHQEFERLRAARLEGLYVGEDQVNALGYSRLRQEKYAEAIMVFQWNVTLFPYSANVHDSLGEAYAKAGERDLAIQSYEKSLSLDPKNANATKKLAELKGAERLP